MGGKRKVLVALSSLAVLAAMGPGPTGTEARANESRPVVVIEGRGHGHGVGMAQDGARWMAVAGAGTPDILGHFYPGATIGRAPGTTVRVDVFTTKGPSAVITFPGGGEIRDSQGPDVSPGFPVVAQPGGSVRLTVQGNRYHAFPLNGATATPVAVAPPAPTTPPPVQPQTPATTVAPDLLGALLAPITSPVTPVPAPPPAPAGAAAKVSEPTSGRALWAIPRGDVGVGIAEQGRSYRGQLLATGGGGVLHLVNHVDLESYLRGMGEVVEPGWPPAALRAQAIAARTYALWATSGGGSLCSTEQCQVYLGRSAEYAAMDRAVSDTRGQVLRYKGALVEAVYSASGGGVSATASEGFGPGSNEHPYFAPKPYTTQDPQPWNVTMGLAELASRAGYRGTATSAVVSQAGPSGRAVAVTFDGDAGPLTVDGRDLAWELSLRSTLFTIRVDRPTDAGAAISDGAAGDGRGSGRAALDYSSNSTALERSASQSLGRAPWVALAALLMATWGSMAHRVTARGRLPRA